MKRFIVSISMFTFLLVSSNASAQFSNVKVLNSIDVIGQAKMMVEPNLIYLSITINEEDTKGKVSVEELEVKMAKALTKSGVNVEKQLTIEGMSSNIQEIFLRKDESRTSKSYTLELYSAKELSKTVTVLEKVGLSNINIERVSHSKLEEIRDSVRVMAIKSAKQKAGLLVKSLDYTLGSAIFISDTNRDYTNNVSGIMMRSVSNSSDFTSAAPELQFKDIKVEQYVNVTFTYAK